MNNILMPSMEKVNYKINRLLIWLYKNDHFLITNATEERSITHKFAEYIQFLFPEWNVDCEDNRRGEGMLEGLPNQDTSYPDVIIHMRNTKSNLLVIEAKKARSKNSTNYGINEHDKNKIKVYGGSPKYYYQFGLWIFFHCKIEEARLHWFINQNGKYVIWQQNRQSNIKTLKREFPNG